MHFAMKHKKCDCNIFKCNISFHIFMLMIFIQILIHIRNCDGNVNCTSMSEKCKEQTNCDRCLQYSECCHYCYDISLDKNISKCLTLENLQAHCKPEFQKLNYGNTYETNNITFQKFKSDSPKDVVQVQPTIFNITLRMHKPINITFTYSPAKDYPLDLYYLLDVSHSMKDHLKIFKHLTMALSDRLKNMTQNYQVAYGSFMDKVGMPFYLMNPTNAENPCHEMGGKCIEGYLFRNHLNFTNATRAFTDAVLKTMFSLSVDNMDGALDAIMQVLTCNLGWKEDSRKLIVVPTQSLLHFAGDGILVGAIKKNDACLLRENYYRKDEHLVYDYPSLDEIMLKLREKKVQLIFATPEATEDLLKYYERLSENSPLKGYMLAKRFKKDDEVSMLDLIEESYKQVTQQVQFTLNLNDSEYITAQYYNNCSGTVEKSEICKNVEIGKFYQFQIELMITKRPNVETIKNFRIEEKHLPSLKLEINLRFTGFCVECLDMNETKTCKNGGEFICDKCVCQNFWAGETCEQGCYSDENECRLNDESDICEGNGLCECSKCICRPEYLGKYCSYYCPYDSKTEKYCSGHGECFKDRDGCDCFENYSGVKCDCSDLTSNCSTFIEEELCSGNGKCECNKCYCDSYYFGKYCEISPEENKICVNFRNDVLEFLKSEGISNQVNGTIQWMTNETVWYEVPEEEKTNCSETFQYDSKICKVNFLCVQPQMSSHVKIFLVSKECSPDQTVAASVTLAGVVALIVILVGLSALLIWKWQITKRDKRICKDFQLEVLGTMKEKKQDDNPLYIHPETNYQNPMYGKHKIA